MSDRRRASLLVAVVAGGLAAVALAPVAVAFVIGLVGATAIALGTVVGSRYAVDAGAVALVLAGVLGTLAGLSAGGAVLVAIGTAIAWDSARTALDLDRVLDGAATSGRAELAHAGVTSLVIAGAGTAALVAAVTGPEGRPVGALLVLCTGILLVGVALAVGE